MYNSRLKFSLKQSVIFKNIKVIFKKENESIQKYKKLNLCQIVKNLYLRSIVVLLFWIELDLEECPILFFLLCRFQVLLELILPSRDVLFEFHLFWNIASISIPVILTRLSVQQKGRTDGIQIKHLYYKEKIRHSSRSSSIQKLIYTQPKMLKLWPNIKDL